ncbi:MAG: element excision factor XisH family protein [Chloroflexota bacterium]
MSTRDVLHDSVKQALIKDGWTITHDPFTITFGLRRAFVDLGAEKVIAAERAGRKFAAEVMRWLD